MINPSGEIPFVSRIQYLISAVHNKNFSTSITNQKKITLKHDGAPHFESKEILHHVTAIMPETNDFLDSLLWTPDIPRPMVSGAESYE